jgi:hypothetical protein
MRPPDIVAASAIDQGPSRTLRCRMERPVRETHFGSPAGLPVKDELFVRDSHEPRSYPTPAEFVAGVGRVLAVCFGLALLAHAIVTAIDVQ